MPKRIRRKEIPADDFPIYFFVFFRRAALSEKWVQSIILRRHGTLSARIHGTRMMARES